MNSGGIACSFQADGDGFMLWVGLEAEWDRDIRRMPKVERAQ